MELKTVLEGVLIFTQHITIQVNNSADSYFDAEYPTYKIIDKILTVTKHGKNHLIDKGVNEDKIEVIYNGIDPNIFKCNQHNKIKEKYGLIRDKKIV